MFLLQKYIFTYVVEDKPNDITDLVSYRLYESSSTDAHIDTVVSTQSPVKQLITDALVCARENGASAATISQHNIEHNVLTSLSFQPHDYCPFHFYNYSYHEISQAKFGFSHFWSSFKIAATIAIVSYNVIYRHSNEAFDFLKI